MRLESEFGETARNEPRPPDAIRAWSSAVEQWREYNQTPWGRLRFDLAWRQLERHVDLSGLRVLDVGCGLGETAARLALNDCDVTAIDASPAMVQAARQIAAARGASVKFSALTVEKVASVAPPESFDLVLCHNVLGYVAAPADACGALGSLLRAGGFVSVIFGNCVAEPFRAALMRHDLRAALTAIEDTTRVRQAGVLVGDYRMSNADEAAKMITDAGLTVIATAGIRVVNDYLIGADELKASESGYNELLQLELALSEREPYWRIATMLHVIGRR